MKPNKITVMEDNMFEIKQEGFFLNGEKINIYSGAMHYFRILPEYWEDRLTKLKLAGFNTVETVLKWNVHEPKRGEFNFEGIADIVKFLQIAQKVGLYAIVRPGPYTCAEWDFGGFPAWLLKDKNMQFRCDNALYMEAVESYFDTVLEVIKPMLITNGGNIIMMQVENEYGSYGNDKTYLAKLKAIMEKYIDVPLFTSDGNWCNMLSGGSMDGLYKVLNFGSGAARAFKCLEPFQKKMPLMCGEFWCGWFDHWTEKHHTRTSTAVVNEIKHFLAQNASFNIYMFHGGTNFGFWAGANYDKFYQPTVTSYDYAAFLTENGDYTPAYHAVREVLLKHQGLIPEPLIDAPKTQYVGEIVFNEFAGLLENLDTIGQLHHNSIPESMEYFDQNFGMIYYKTVMDGKYDGQQLNVDGVHDRAHVFVNGKRKVIFDRALAKRKKGLFGKTQKHSIHVGGFTGKCEIGVLVDAMGRVNYGKHLIDRKGITNISFGNQYLFGYDIYTLPLDNLEKLTYTNKKLEDTPMFMRSTFNVKTQSDTYVDMTGFTKGSVWVNGFNLGRYWNVGPQTTLYLPGVLLKTDEPNEIVVLELEKVENPTLQIIASPKL